MQENNVVYEIAEKIQDKNIVKNDFKEAIFLVSNLFKEKYVDKLQEELISNVKNLRANPTKELNLLNAIKPFLVDEERKNLDGIIDIMTGLSAVNFMMPKQVVKDNDNIIRINNFNNQDSSVKEDGVYDIDEDCLLRMNKKQKNNGMLDILLIIFLLKGLAR